MIQPGALFFPIHPELEKEKFESVFAVEYGQHKNMADLFRCAMYLNYVII